MGTKLIVALDVPDMGKAAAVLRNLEGVPNLWFKIGMQLFVREGPKVIEMAKTDGHNIFLDLKFKDISNTVRGAAESATRLGVGMFNVHADGGVEMMKAAVEGARSVSGTPSPLILGVTVLTSQTAEPGQVLKLARDSKDAGLDGVVCSGLEALDMSERLGKKFVLVCPGIRPVWDPEVGDQKRITTPEQAAKAGAHFIVVGRTILNAKDPAAAAIRIQEELTEAA